MFKSIPKNYLYVLLIIVISAIVLSISVGIFVPLKDNSLQTDINKTSKVIFATAVKCVKRDFESADTVTSAFDVYDNTKTNIGYIFEVHSQGYNSIIKMYVGIDLNGRIIGLDIPSTEETDEIGSKIMDKSFTDQFISKEGVLTPVTGSATLPDEISIISGATVSSNAVITGVNHALAAYKTLED